MPDSRLSKTERAVASEIRKHRDVEMFASSVGTDRLTDEHLRIFVEKAVDELDLPLSGRDTDERAVRIGRSLVEDAGSSYTGKAGYVPDSISQRVDDYKAEGWAESPVGSEARGMLIADILEDYGELTAGITTVSGGGQGGEHVARRRLEGIIGQMFPDIKPADVQAGIDAAVRRISMEPSYMDARRGGKSTEKGTGPRGAPARLSLYMDQNEVLGWVESSEGSQAHGIQIADILEQQGELSSIQIEVGDRGGGPSGARRLLRERINDMFPEVRGEDVAAGVKESMQRLDRDALHGRLPEEPRYGSMAGRKSDGPTNKYTTQRPTQVESGVYNEIANTVNLDMHIEQAADEIQQGGADGRSFNSSREIEQYFETNVRPLIDGWLNDNPEYEGTTVVQDVIRAFYDGVQEEIGVDNQYMRSDTTKRGYGAPGPERHGFDMGAFNDLYETVNLDMHIQNAVDEIERGMSDGRAFDTQRAMEEYFETNVRPLADEWLTENPEHTGGDVMFELGSVFYSTVASELGLDGQPYMRSDTVKRGGKLRGTGRVLAGLGLGGGTGGGMGGGSGSSAPESVTNRARAVEMAFEMIQQGIMTSGEMDETFLSLQQDVEEVTSAARRGMFESARIGAGQLEGKVDSLTEYESVGSADVQSLKDAVDELEDELERVAQKSRDTSKASLTDGIRQIEDALEPLEDNRDEIQDAGYSSGLVDGLSRQTDELQTLAQTRDVDSLLATLESMAETVERDMMYEPAYDGLSDELQGDVYDLLQTVERIQGNVQQNIATVATQTGVGDYQAPEYDDLFRSDVQEKVGSESFGHAARLAELRFQPSHRGAGFAQCLECGEHVRRTQLDLHISECPRRDGGKAQTDGGMTRSAPGSEYLSDMTGRLPAGFRPTETPGMVQCTDCLRVVERERADIHANRECPEVRGKMNEDKGGREIPGYLSDMGYRAHEEPGTVQCEACLKPVDIDRAEIHAYGCPGR